MVAFGRGRKNRGHTNWNKKGNTKHPTEIMKKEVIISQVYGRTLLGRVLFLMEENLWMLMTVRTCWYYIPKVLLNSSSKINWQGKKNKSKILQATLPPTSMTTKFDTHMDRYKTDCQKMYTTTKDNYSKTLINKIKGLIMWILIDGLSNILGFLEVME